MMSITCRKKIFVKICRKDIEAGKIDVLIVDEKIVGTGSRTDNHITRVYVLPEYEGKGYGTEIMNHLESEIFSAYDYCDLDASLRQHCFMNIVDIRQWNIRNIISVTVKR